MLETMEPLKRNMKPSELAEAAFRDAVTSYLDRVLEQVYDALVSQPSRTTFEICMGRAQVVQERVRELLVARRYNLRCLDPDQNKWEISGWAQEEKQPHPYR
jgi:hypothetical protein